MKFLAGIEHNHNCLRLAHGDFNSENILLSTDGSINIGTKGLKSVLSFLADMAIQQILEQAC